MMNTMKMTAAALAALLVLWLGTAVAGEKHHKEVDEEKLGIRKESLFEEESVKPEHGEYSHAEPGKSQKLGRAFENSPPLIPHDLTGMLPIAETNNSCLNCHMPDVALSIGATPMPKSHFFDIEKGKNLGNKLDGKRYFCMECHVPQVNIPEAIKNEFKGEFRTKKSRTRSDLLETLNEGVKAE